MSTPNEPDAIETLWKEAFVDPNSLTAPRVVDLYDRKSTHIIDRLQRMFRANIQWIGVAIVALPVLSLILGAPIAGFGVALLLALVVLRSRAEKARLEQIDRSGSSYGYLTAFLAWRRGAMRRFTNLYRLVYPAIVLVFAGGIWFSSRGDQIRAALVDEVPDLTLIAGIPLSLLLPVLGVALLMALFAGPIYRLDVNLIYGRQFTQLEEIVADMEELRGPSSAA